MKVFKINFNKNEANDLSDKINKYNVKIIYNNKLYSSKDILLNKTKINYKLLLLDTPKTNINGKMKSHFPCTYLKYDLYNPILIEIDKIYGLLLIHGTHKYKVINMDKFFAFLKYKCKIYKLIYLINTNNLSSNKNKNIKIFGEKYVNNNNDKCILFYNDKMFTLEEYFELKNINIKNINNNKFEIFLIELKYIPDRSYMFHECKHLEQFILLENFDYLSIKCKNEQLKKEEEKDEGDKLDIYDYNEYNENEESSKKENSYTFSSIHKKSISKMSFTESELNISSPFKDYQVKNMSYMFYGCTSLLSIPDDISDWNTKTTNDISYMFFGCSSLKSLPDISKWNTFHFTNLKCIFNSCSSLVTLPDISKWRTNNVKIMSGIFSLCKLLRILPDLSLWNTDNVIDMSLMFFGCSSLISLPDISKWNTNNVINMNLMFYSCKSLISLPDLSKWDIKSMRIMGSLCAYCSSLISLPDIAKWNTKNIKDMKYMLKSCISLISFPSIIKCDNISKLFK